MKNCKLDAQDKKIINAMDKVYDNLIAFKKRMNSELVVIKDNKIVYVKP
jgi:hypothetical protein